MQKSTKHTQISFGILLFINLASFKTKQKKIDFVSFSHQTTAQRIQAQKDQERQQIFLNKKYEEYVKEMNGIMKEQKMERKRIYLTIGRFKKTVKPI